MTILSRRSFFIGASASLIAAPAVVRAASLMPIRATRPLLTMDDYYRLIMEPMLDKLAKAHADAIMNGIDTTTGLSGLLLSHQDDDISMKFVDIGMPQTVVTVTDKGSGPFPYISLPSTRWKS